MQNVADDNTYLESLYVDTRRTKYVLNPSAYVPLRYESSRLIKINVKKDYLLLLIVTVT